MSSNNCKEGGGGGGGGRGRERKKERERERERESERRGNKYLSILLSESQFTCSAAIVLIGLHL